MEKRLYRDELNKKVAGVCAGIADYLNVDVTIVRVIFALALVLKGGGALVYFVLWAVLPKKPYYLNNPNNPTVDYTVPPQPYNPFADRGTVPPFAMPPKKRSNGGLYAGIAMVLFGSLFLIREFDIFPFINFHQVWPIIFIIMGVVVIFGGTNKTPASAPPVEKEKWEGAEKKDDTATPDVPAYKPENE